MHGGGWFGDRLAAGGLQARQVDILSHIGPRYPATYLTDGNQPDTFPEHAKAMARRLREHNLDHQFTMAFRRKHGQDNPIEAGAALLRTRPRNGTANRSRD